MQPGLTDVSVMKKSSISRNVTGKLSENRVGG